MKEITITVRVVERGPAVICDADRFIMPAQVEEIERDLNIDDEPWWPDGAETVQCKVTYMEEEMDCSMDPPRVAYRAYWDISDVRAMAKEVRLV